jgi:hypothetical protein
MKHTVSMAIRSLGTRPSHTLLTITGIVLGVAVILAISITNLSTMDSWCIDNGMVAHPERLQTAT